MNANPQELRLYLMDQLGSKFLQLEDELGISKTKLTQWINRPQKMKPDEVQLLAKHLGKDPIHLVKWYHCGYETLSLSEVSEMETKADPIFL